VKILAATDGSRAAGAAVRYAAWLACRLRGARLEVVLVGDSPSASVLRLPGRLVSVLEKEERGRVRRAFSSALRASKRFGAPVATRYVEARGLAPIAEAISRAADASRADLIVVGSTGRGALERALFGSVAERLVHVARRPVVVVPASFAIGPRQPLRILAATDGSPAATAAVRVAGRLVQGGRGRRLTIACLSTLRRDLALTAPRFLLGLFPLEELRASDRRAGGRVLRRAARQAGAPAECRFVEPRGTEPVADVLAREARRGGHNLLLVGNTGAGALAEWALGSTTRRLLHVSRRPVGVVRPASPRRPR
jgi:nucleotide-binding universal stress UspA family protein